MANPEQTSLFKRSILWLCVLLAVVGLTYYYEENLFRDGWEALTASTATKELPIYNVQTDKKQVALSFDAAWGNEDTKTILDTLKKYKIHVTFFMTGGWVESYPDDVKAIQKAGHDLGNHSENHKHMPQLSTSGMCDELNKVTEKVKKLTGTTMCLFRPPYGDYDNNLIIQAKNCGYYTIQWNVDNDHTNGRKLNLPFDIYFVIINIYSFYVVLNHFFLLIKREFFERYWFYFFCLTLFCKHLVNRIFLFI